MATDTTGDETTLPAPEAAFSVLGNEVRLEVLRTLGEADDPLAYSELFRRMAYDDSANFTYHLEKLVGHFVAKTDAGYVLRRPGERVMEAVLSGAVTTDPVRERTQTSRPCPFCSSPIEVGYEQERVVMHCPECSGLLEETDNGEMQSVEAGNLGFRPLPPAALEGRTATELHDVSKTWTALGMHAIGRGICPQCSGSLDRSLDVCASHEVSRGTCDECGLRFGAAADAACRNCVFEMRAGVAAHLAAHTELMRFMLDHGVDPLAPEGFHPYAVVEETIRSRNPFEAQYSYTLDDETLVLTVDADLSVVDATRQRADEPPG